MTPAERLEKLAASHDAIGSDRTAHALRLGATALRDSEWLDIAGAPKDGTKVELWVPGMPNNKYGDHRANFGKWDTDQYARKPKPHWKYDCYLGKTFERENQPTHYRPLPSPPKEQSNG